MTRRFLFPSLKPRTAGSPVAEVLEKGKVLEAASEQLLQAARESPEAVLTRLNSTAEGLSELQSMLRLARVGPNRIAHEQPVSWAVQLLNTFRNPLVALLATLAAISLLSGDSKAAVIIIVMILFSVILRFSQEYRSLRAAESLRQLVHTTATVLRHDARKDISPGLAADLGLHLSADAPGSQEIPIDRLVPGDVVRLSAGDMIPADVRLLRQPDDPRPFARQIPKLLLLQRAARDSWLHEPRLQVGPDHRRGGAQRRYGDALHRWIHH